MSHKEPIDEKLENLGKVLGSDEKFVENVMKRIENKPTIKFTQNKHNVIWSKVMRNPVRKLTAAAIIIIAVIVGLNIFQFSSPVYGISDVPRILRSSHTLHFKGWQCGSVQPGLYERNIVQPGQKDTRTLLEYWIDMDTGATKNIGPSNIKVEDNKVSVSTFTSIYDGEFSIEYGNESKTVILTKYSPYQQLIRKKKNIASSLDNIVHMLDTSNQYKIISQEKFDGSEYDIWQTEYAEPSFGGEQFRTKVWVCPDNGRLGKMELWLKMKDTGWFQQMEINQIEYNVTLSENIFETKIPEGYSSAYTKETVPSNEMVQNASYYFYDYEGKLVSQRFATHACFTLNDGSVILGWSCSFNEHGSEIIIPNADSYQEEIFPKLTIGGQLPELHIVYYNVSPINEKQNIKYKARHLAYTKKNDVFYEWSIYVPEKKLDKYFGTLGYNTYYRNNLSEKDGATTLGGDIPINNVEVFNTFVLGAMVELSDDGKAPEDITYEKVLSLAQQIRKSFP